MTHAAPGWYPDETAEGRLRFWDGRAWTDHFYTPPAEEEPAAPAIVPTTPSVDEPGGQSEAGWAVPPSSTAPESVETASRPASSPEHSSPSTARPAGEYEWPSPAAPALAPRRKARVWPWVVGAIAIVVIVVPAMIGLAAVLIVAEDPQPDPAAAGSAAGDPVAEPSPTPSPSPTVDEVFTGVLSARLAQEEPEVTGALERLVVAGLEDDCDSLVELLTDGKLGHTDLDDCDNPPAYALAAVVEMGTVDATREVLSVEHGDDDTVSVTVAVTEQWLQNSLFDLVEVSLAKVDGDFRVASIDEGTIPGPGTGPGGLALFPENTHEPAIALLEVLDLLAVGDCAAVEAATRDDFLARSDGPCGSDGGPSGVDPASRDVAFSATRSSGGQVSVTFYESWERDGERYRSRCVAPVERWAGEWLPAGLGCPLTGYWAADQWSLKDE